MNTENQKKLLNPAKLGTIRSKPMLAGVAKKLKLKLKNGLTI
jgi:hypothetical protein